jgi:hypothetical protein
MGVCICHMCQSSENVGKNLRDSWHVVVRQLKSSCELINM